MRAALFACAALFAASVAFAQDAPPQTNAPPSVSPSAITFESHGLRHRVYPSSALAHGTSGVVHMCCTARTDRRLDCRVAIEWPRGQGFGASALQMSRDFRLSEASYAALQVTSNATVQLPVRWEVMPAPPELAGDVQRIHESARDLCGPSTGEAPEYIVIQAQRVESPNRRMRGSTQGFDRDIPGSLPQPPEH